MNVDRPICIAGAGSIGCFVGGMLAAAGRDVVLLARPRVIYEIRTHGLRLTSLEGLDQRISPESIGLSDHPAVLADARIILVTVKSADTAGMAELIAQHAPSDAVIVSLQNGVGNIAVLLKYWPGRHVLGAMVPFNAVTLGEGRYHRATSGNILVEKDRAGTAAELSVKGLMLKPTDDIVGVQWGKLLVNLNNALNALSNMPLREQLARRSWWCLFADQMAEGLAVLKADGIRPISATPLSVNLTLRLLRLPDLLFSGLLGRTMKIDPNARSSMWEDLQRGRHTEIDYLQGVIVEKAKQHGMPARLSQRIVALIGEAEAARKGSPGLSAEQIRG